MRSDHGVADQIAIMIMRLTSKTINLTISTKKIEFAQSLHHNGASTSLSCRLKLCQKMKAFMAYFFVKFEIVCD